MPDDRPVSDLRRRPRRLLHIRRLHSAQAGGSGGILSRGVLVVVMRFACDRPDKELHRHGRALVALTSICVHHPLAACHSVPTSAPGPGCLPTRLAMGAPFCSNAAIGTLPSNLLRLLPAQGFIVQRSTRCAPSTTCGACAPSKTTMRGGLSPPAMRVSKRTSQCVAQCGPQPCHAAQ